MRKGRKGSFVQDQNTVRKGRFLCPGVGCRAGIPELFHRDGTRPLGWGQPRDTAVSPSSSHLPFIHTEGFGIRTEAQNIPHTSVSPAGRGQALHRVYLPAWSHHPNGRGLWGLWPHPSPASPTGEKHLGTPWSLRKGHNPRHSSDPKTAAVVWGAGPTPQAPKRKDPARRIGVNGLGRSLGRENRTSVGSMGSTQT